jgi:hypothetical protein
VREAPDHGLETPAPQAKADSFLKPALLDPSRIPRITRRLVLGHHFERLVQEGIVKDYAEASRLTGMSRARVTQVVNLTLLASEIQEEILLPTRLDIEREPNYEGGLRQIGLSVEWNAQS